MRRNQAARCPDRYGLDVAGIDGSLRTLPDRARIEESSSASGIRPEQDDSKQ